MAQLSHQDASKAVVPREVARIDRFVRQGKRQKPPIPLSVAGFTGTCARMGLMQDISRSRAPLAGFFVIAISWASFSAQVPVLKSDIGASDGVYGIVMLLGTVGAFLAMWLAPLAHAYTGRYSLIVGSVLVGLGFLAVGMTTHLVLFACALGLMAAGAGIVDVLVNAELSESEARTGRPLMNLNHGLYSFAYGGAALVTGWLREAGWSPLQIFAVFSVAIAALCFTMRIGPRTPEPEDAQAPDGVRIPLGFVVTAGAVVLIAFLTEASAEGWSALHLERTLGGGAAEGALGPAILGLTMGFGRLGGHWLAHRWDDIGLMMLALLVAAAGLCLAGVAPNLMIAYLGFGLGGLGISVVAPLALGLLGRTVPAKARLVAISRASAIGYGAFFLGPPLMGFVAEGFGLRSAFVVVAALLGLSALALVPVLGRQAQRLRNW